MLADRQDAQSILLDAVAECKPIKCQLALKDLKKLSREFENRFKHRKHSLFFDVAAERRKLTQVWVEHIRTRTHELNGSVKFLQRLPRGDEIHDFKFIQTLPFNHEPFKQNVERATRILAIKGIHIVYDEPCKPICKIFFYHRKSIFLMGTGAYNFEADCALDRQLGWLLTELENESIVI